MITKLIDMLSSEGDAERLQHEAGFRESYSKETGPQPNLSMPAKMFHLC